MSETPDAIADLLQQADRCQPVVREFAWVWLEAYRRDAIEVVRGHRNEGRTAALTGADLEEVRQRTEARLQVARERLLGRLQRLLAWARESGRADGTTPPAPDSTG